MSEQAKAVGVSDKMKAKDYITLGIFTVLFFVHTALSLNFTSMVSSPISSISEHFMIISSSLPMIPKALGLP
mgnify:CR=1 FL=1